MAKLSVLDRLDPRGQQRGKALDGNQRAVAVIQRQQAAEFGRR